MMYLQFNVIQFTGNCSQQERLINFSFWIRFNFTHIKLNCALLKDINLEVFFFGIIFKKWSQMCFALNTVFVGFCPCFKIAMNFQITLEDHDIIVERYSEQHKKWKQDKRITSQQGINVKARKAKGELAVN